MLKQGLFAHQELELKSPGLSIQLVCLDLDGTVLSHEDSGGDIDSDLITTLNQLAPIEVDWCTNSGRTLADQIHILERAQQQGLAHFPCALICRGDLIFERRYGTYVPNQQWNERVQCIFSRFHDELQARFSGQLASLIEQHRPSRICLGEEGTAFLLDGDSCLVDEMLRDLKRLAVQVANGMVCRNGNWIYAFPDTLGKGNVIREFMRSTKRVNGEVLVIGDSENDLNMLDGSVSPHVGCPADAIERIIEVVSLAGGLVARAAGPLGTVEVISHFLGERLNAAG